MGITPNLFRHQGESLTTTGIFYKMFEFVFGTLSISVKYRISEWVWANQLGLIRNSNSRKSYHGLNKLLLVTHSFNNRELGFFFSFPSKSGWFKMGYKPWYLLYWFCNVFSFPFIQHPNPYTIQPIHHAHTRLTVSLSLSCILILWQSGGNISVNTIWKINKFTTTKIFE